MARFRYTALDRSGKTISGEIAAEEPEEVKRRLREMGYFPSEIAEAAQFVLTSGPSRVTRGRGVNATDIVIFTRQLADMTAAHLPLFRSLSVLHEQADRQSLRQLVEAIRADVQQGRPLSEALSRHPRHFPDLYVNMVHAGETSGHLDAILLRLADFLEKSMQRRSQVVSALMYPAVLITVAIAAVTFIIIYLIPKLETLFAEMEQTLPLITQLLLSFAGVMQRVWWILAIVIVAAVLFLRWYAHTPAGRETVDRLALRLPLFGPIWHKMAVSRLARTLGTMLTGGVPILTALEIAGNAIANRPMARATEMAREEVRQGTRISDALSRSGVFPPLLVHMSAVGEETGQLPEMMIRVADNLDFQVDSTLGRLTTLLEPFIIIVMGAIVAFIVTAVLLPIFQINASIGQ
jgi:type II secretion system protein F